MIKQKTIIGIFVSAITACILFVLWWEFIRPAEPVDDGSEPVVKEDTVTLSESDLDKILQEEKDFTSKTGTEDPEKKEEIEKELPIANDTETPGEESLDPHLQSAKELLKNFLVDEAGKELELADKSAETMYYKALLEAYRGQTDTAKQYFNEAKNIDNGGSIITMYADKYLDTYALFATFNDAAPEYLDTLISKVFLSTGELQLGIAKLKFVVSVNPEYSDAKILLGSAYMVHGNIPKAIETLTSALPTERAEVYYWLGLAYYYNDNYSKALTAYKQAVNKKYTPLYKVYEKIGDIFLSQKEYDNAADYFVKACSEPDAVMFIDLYIKPVWIYNDILNNPEEGLKISERAMQYNPNSAMSGNLMGWSYIALGEYDRALEYLEDAAEKDPEIPAIYLNLGLAYKGAGDFDEAEKNLKKAASMDDAAIGRRAEAELAGLKEDRETAE